MVTAIEPCPSRVWIAFGCSPSAISQAAWVVVTVIDQELTSVAEAAGDDSPVLAQRVGEQLARREAEIASRELAVSAAEQRQFGGNEHLLRWDTELQTMAQRDELAAKLASQRPDATPKVGRNE